MLPDRITKNFKEISKFFVENFDNSANAIFTVLDMLKLSDKSLCFSTNYNAKYSQTVKFILILLMPFFRIRNVLNYFFFKECKQHLLLNSCQSVDFDVQIAEITFSFIRFNILSTILRKQKYDTMGGLFEEITKDTLELTINERIILFIRNLVENIKKQLYDYKSTLLVGLNIYNQSVRKMIKLE